MPQPRKRKPSRPHAMPGNIASQSSTPELIDPRWIVKALGIVLSAALVLAWGTLCLLWYQGQWQLVLHPSRTVAATPAVLGLNFTEVHFADDATGQPQLNGWLIRSETTSAPTALILHGADGSIGSRSSDSDALPRALTLHNAHLNVLLFDYRGYGRSAGQHPTQATMQQDAEGALKFLVSTQHIAPQNIIVYGQGIGASLAANLAAQHHEIAALILDAPDGDLTERVVHDPHSSLVPARLLFHEDFPLAAPLRTLKTPKLLITYTKGGHPPAALANAADPKVTVELPSPDDPALLAALQRFLDQYVTHAAQ